MTFPKKDKLNFAKNANYRKLTFKTFVWVLSKFAEQAKRLSMIKILKFISDQCKALS